MQERFDINQSLPSVDENTNLIWVLSLYGAVDISFENDVAKILINNAADVNAQNNKGQTALMIAAYFGNLEMVKKLNENNADFSKKDLGKHTALDYAAFNNHQDIIDYIKAKK